MAIVKFSDVDEFLQELRLDASKVDRSLVRLTFRHTQGSPPFRGMAVLASAMVAGHLVALESHCGTFMHDTKEAEDVRTKATERFRLLESAVKDIGLEVRNGSFALS